MACAACSEQGTLVNQPGKRPLLEIGFLLFRLEVGLSSASSWVSLPTKSLSSRLLFCSGAFRRRPTSSKASTASAMCSASLVIFLKSRWLRSLARKVATESGSSLHMRMLCCMRSCGDNSARTGLLKESGVLSRSRSDMLVG